MEQYERERTETGRGEGRKKREGEAMEERGSELSRVGRRNVKGMIEELRTYVCPSNVTVAKLSQ